MNQWLTDTQFSKIERHLPTDTRGKARVDDRRVISGIVHVLKSGGRWIDAPSERIAAARPPCPARTTLSLPEQVGREYETSEAWQCGPMTITSEQVSKARWLLGWPMRGLAEVSKLSHSTIGNFETGKRRPTPPNVQAIRHALEIAGAEFIEGAPPDVRLRTRE